ncbi:NADH-quinone oxidoreductase subunit N [Methylococcus capsulatus]|uniref:NADH-quinone oxidoreductase subunit N n=1 Tax=Methylococcus capsulatus TaxID=414 RepID=UPI001C52B495|nr:NADH-quinone oxidoreductase subunit N [Methylococcus capsulatus]QXP87942.1 NADH-quinone oxidoreductase subunit N [Methylococcus capsulatus]QXP92317.1 NADH-quinone oxidoreductase subunit N [Methylococcus capsulatus]UQN12966.1 NADH-quinone oxidoreductase subunit N [Methylococcus capsulatus]
MTTDALTALLPFIVLSAAAVAVMLAIAIRRSFRLVFWLTIGGLLAGLSTLPHASSVAPLQVTDLLRVDAYGLFFHALFLLAALVVALLCLAYFRRRENENEEIFVLLLTSTLGALLLVSSAHLAMFFLGLEVLTISLFPMIAYSVRASRPLEAGIKYLMLSGLASSFLMFGMALVYGDLGVLSFEQIGAHGAELEQKPLALAGLFLILAAIGFKLSLVPFHLWTPDVYQGAPTPVTAFLATVSKASVFALLLRFFTAERSETFLCVLGLLAVVSILAGNLLALLQVSLKRLLAYSSIAHMGYLLTGFVAAGLLRRDLQTETIAFYLAAYTVTSLTAFGAISALSDDDRESDRLSDYAGLFWRSPWLAAVLTLSLLSLAGIPLTVGFVGKFYVFAVGVQAETWPLVATVVIGSGIGIYYYLRVVLTMIQPAGVGQRVTLHPAAGAALAAAALVILAAGLFPQPLIDAAANVPQPPPTADSP